MARLGPETRNRTPPLCSPSSPSAPLPQVADIRAALHLYQERMDRVLAERRVISGQLSGVLSQLVQRGVGHAYQVERMQLLVRAEELQQQLSRNVAMEGQCAGIIKVGRLL